MPKASVKRLIDNRKEKPVGLVYIGVKKGKALLIKKNKFKSKNRNSIQKSTVRTVIEIISKII